VIQHNVYALYNPHRLVIDCVTAPGSLPAAAPQPRVAQAVVPSLGARRLGPGWTTLPPAKAAASGALSAAAAPPPVLAASQARADSGVTSPAVAPPARNLGGGFSVARQLGLSIARIVIDPGHGGHDPGAIGEGVTEADLVLDVALRLEQLLTAVPGVEVVLTRRTDQFVALQDRTAAANRHEADLFLSIHANASPNGQAKGVETYFLNFATTSAAKTVAARENAASGMAMGELPDLIKMIALNDKLEESRDLATIVQRALVDRLKVANTTVRDLGVKQAPFMVLIGASMPSVLAEIAFVSNSEEVRLVRDAPYRQRIAEGLFNAIEKYRTSLRAADKIAQNP
jgi:N-acetylmuramoyl-L-alanine amidase